MDALWLKNTVGDPLLNGLAAVAEFQPEDSVDFLGRYLLKYVESKEAESRREEFSKKVKLRLDHESIQRKQLQDEEAKAEEAKQITLEMLEKDLAYFSQECKIVFDENLHGSASETGVADALHQNLLLKYEKLIEATKKATQSSNVYIGEVIAGPESQELKILASSNGEIIGRRIIEEKTEEGVSNFIPFEVIQENEAEEEDAPNTANEENGMESEEGSEEKESSLKLKLPRYAYVENVLRNPRVPFFERVPLLGSFLSVCVPFEDSMHKNAIPQDGGLLVPENVHEDETADNVEEGNGDAENNSNNSASVSKSWRAETIESSLVLCVDTMGMVSGKKLSKNEIEITRKLANALSSSITPTLRSMYQAEMMQRDSLNELNDINTTLLAEALAQTEQVIEAKVDALQSEGSDGDTDISEDEKTWKTALIKFNGYKNAIINESWWVNQLRNVRKLRIESKDELARCILLFLNIFLWTGDKSQLDWSHDFKTLDIDHFVSQVRSIAPDTESISSEKASQYLEEITALGDSSTISSDVGAWAAALASYSKVTLEALIVNQNYKLHLLALKEAAAAENAENEEAS